jgi:anaerobic selenocysteine-containing dehydrogenase
MGERVVRTCNLCEAMCGLELTVDQGRVTEIRGDEADVLSRGHLCPKGPALRDFHEDPDRLRRPLRRAASASTGDAGTFAPVSWDAALAEAAEGIARVQRAHGRDAVAIYIGNPAVHNHGAVLGSQALTVALGTRNRFDANSQDANPRLWAALQMYGEATSLTVPDVDRTDYLLVLGANPAASNGSVMSLGDVRGRLQGIRARGGKLVVVDPRRTETAEWADEHHFLRPGGDAALLLAMLEVIFSERLHDPAAIGRVAEGLGELERLASRFPPERVAGAVGMEASVIRKLARELAAAERAAVYSRMGVCTSAFGPTASWLVEALDVVTGNFDRPGGAMFAKPAIDLSVLARRLGLNHAGRWATRVRKLPELGGNFPAAAMAEEMETPGEGQIRGLVTLAGNPVLSVPGSERLARALSKLDFMVSIDTYVNETTRHAHVVLPPRSPLERGHYDVVMHTLAVRNTAKWSPPSVPPEPDSRDDFTILWELALRITEARGGPLGAAARLARRVGPPNDERLIDLLLRAGPYPGLDLAALRAAPHGIDLGPLVPMRKERVRTKTGLVALAPPALVADVPRVERWVEEARGSGLVLIGRRHLRSNNSWLHNLPKLVAGRDRATLLMSPGDAAARGLASGAMVRVRGRAGEVMAKLEITDAVMPGVVSLPHGFGHGEAAETMRVAGSVPGPNANQLTDELAVEPLTGTAILNGVPVEVEGQDPSPARPAV